MTEITESVLHDPAVLAAIEAAEAKLKAAAESPPAPVVAPPAPPEPKPEGAVTKDKQDPLVIEAKIAITLPRVEHPTTMPPVGYNSRVTS